MGRFEKITSHFFAAKKSDLIDIYNQSNLGSSMPDQVKAVNYSNIREEELKNKIASDYFAGFDTTKIIGNVDFCITQKVDQIKEILFPTQSLLWAEAKKGQSNIYHSFVQLILTIGKARTFDKELPPPYLGAFDSQKVAFIAYNQIQEIFYQNDFNWNVPPSNYDTKEFKQIYAKVEQILASEVLIFSYETEGKELRNFIKQNFVAGKSETSKIQIDKNNFLSVYNKWRIMVKPSIIVNWDTAKKHGIIDGYFYIADLLSEENQSLKENLFVLLKGSHYQLDKKLDDSGFWSSRQANFNDNQKAHRQFWNHYQRPPREEYWDYILERQDLLVPQDVRERKGSFFTPQIWVEKSQQYLTDVLGQNWQDEYYIWDCCAGTGNLLAGLTNKYNIYASTLDQADVDVMKERIDTMNEKSASGNGANLLHDHVFQFDFLNDDFEDEKVPKSLREILRDPEKRKKLVIYINPPYAENGSGGGKGAGKAEVSSKNLVYQKYTTNLGRASRELFAQFFLRIYEELSGCYLSSFSKLKHINSQNFVKFRNYFLAEFKKGFVTPADTFDNVKGQFPIGFLIWNLDKKERIKSIKCDVFDKRNVNIGEKSFYSNENFKYINDWIIQFKSKGLEIANLFYNSNDFQHQNFTYLSTNKVAKSISKLGIVNDNLIISAIYFSVRLVEEATWLNDRDQFLFPNDGWKSDLEFQTDCLALALFHGQNRISSKVGTNHWIPFTESEVNARERFESHFMTDFMKGKIEHQKSDDLLTEIEQSETNDPLEFSAEAKAVFEAGRELWKYYQQCPLGDGSAGTGVSKNYNVNASLYDIKEYFQGRDAKGRMNNQSSDEKYTLLIGNLRQSLKILSLKIQPKVYEFGFLLG